MMQPWVAWPHQIPAVTCCEQFVKGWDRKEDSKGSLREGSGLPGIGTQLHGSLGFHGPCSRTFQTGRALASS